jgi:hypothetical protein
MFETTMPRARQASRSMLLAPVAATATICKAGSAAISSASICSLLTMAIVAPASRSLTSLLQGLRMFDPVVRKIRPADCGDDRLTLEIDDAVHGSAQSTQGLS